MLCHWLCFPSGKGGLRGRVLKRPFLPRFHAKEEPHWRERPNESLVQADDDAKGDQNNEQEFHRNWDIPREQKKSHDDDDGVMQDVKG